MRPRIAFVDDEPSVVQGLRNLLRRQRKVWDMGFFTSGDEVLAALDQGHFDVVVSDMKMPGMDGVALLRKVCERSPDTARIMLSGHSDSQEIERALPVAHQFLSKPCSADTIKDVVARAFQVQEMLRDEGLRELVGRLERLPILPRTYRELDRLSREPNVGIMDLAEVVEQDPGISAKVLQLVNSSFFGLAQRQTSVRKAVGYLGAERLKALALSAEMAMRAGSTAPSFDLEAYHEHSILVARLAKCMAGPEPMASRAFSAGLMHDIGRLVLAGCHGETYEEVLREVTERGRPLHRAERKIMGASHAQVGAYLLGMWGLPSAVVEAVGRHHSGTLGEDDEIAAMLQVAEGVAAEAHGHQGESCPGRASLELSPFRDRLDRWEGQAQEEMGRMGKMCA